MPTLQRRIRRWRWVLPLGFATLSAGADFDAMRSQVAALANLTAPPRTYPAEHVTAEGAIRPLYFEGHPWRGRPTRVFAWLGVPASPRGKVPAVVLVHGGGGTAFKEWVKKWNDHGFAAIAMGLEGQTDVRNPDGGREAQWLRHAWAGPARTGVYGDAAEPLADQWMFHALADVVLGHSLLRSLPEVDPARIGVCGISWGGIITSTVVGIDSRLAFGIPIYGCGDLAQGAEHYVRALRDEPVYHEVWEPLRWLPRARMPLLWLTGPRDTHFSLEIQQRSYRAATGPRMVSVPFDMRHSHPAGWNPPDSYAFARSIVETGKPWGREEAQERQGSRVSVTFTTSHAIDAAHLVYKSGADWQRTPATLEPREGGIAAHASLPPEASAYFFNLAAGGLTLSSEVMTAVARSAAKDEPSSPDSRGSARR